MRIGMLLNVPFPPDIRVEKEARTLHAAGHDICLLAASRQGVADPVQQSYGDVLVERVPPLYGLTHWLNRGYYYLTFRDLLWSGAIRRFIAEHDIDVLHVHDLPLARTAIRVAQRTGLPVVLDLHENYPAAISFWHRQQSSLRRWITASHDRWLAYERWAVAHASHVVVVVDEAKQRLVAAHGVQPDKVSTVMNVEDLVSDHGAAASADPATPSAARFIVLYVGGGGEERGLDTAVRALPHVRDLRPPPQLAVVGLPASERGALAMLASQLEVAHLVELVAWQSMEAVRARIEQSHVGIVPYHRNAHTDGTIPHKLFQYMSAGRPVVVSDCPPLKRIVEQTESGLVFQGGDPADLARQLRRLHQSASLRQAFGRSGREAIRTRYNWARESRALVTLYDRLASQR